jgi:hypothetical protein
LLGLGLGFILLELLKRNQIKNHFFVVERRAELFKAALQIHDMREVFQNEKVHLIIGAETTAVLNEIRKYRDELSSQEVQLIAHPTLSRLDYDYYSSLIRYPEKNELKELGEEPKVSIIMPTYNRSYIIRRALDSIEAQTYKQWELIVVDDGSTDDTWQVMRECQLDNVKYIKTSHGGVSRARNVGLNHATGECIAYLDTDDEWSPHFLELMVKGMKSEPNVGLAYCSNEIIFKIKKDTEWREVRRKVCVPFNYFDLLSKIFMFTCCVMHRRECTQEVGGFDEGMEACEDWDLFLRIGQKYKIIFVPHLLSWSHQRRGGDSITDTTNFLSSFKKLDLRIQNLLKTRILGEE